MVFFLKRQHQNFADLLGPNHSLVCIWCENKMNRVTDHHEEKTKAKQNQSSL